MNLANDPWIPIVWSDGKLGSVSLSDAFEHGDEIRDLAVRPHERIALMRLLICVAQVALDGPVDSENWKTCRSNIPAATAEYLAGWRKAFELFGDGQRFLQISGLKKPMMAGEEEEAGNSTSKLDLALASGNNSTLFDNAGGAPREFAPASLATMLLTFQCFSPGGRIGVALWEGEQTPGKGSSNHSPCLAGGMLHTLIRGNTLLDALHRNLLNKAQVKQLYGDGHWGRAVWELMPQHLADDEAIQNATSTYLGRLIPLSRAIYFTDDCRSSILANGLDYPSYEGREFPASLRDCG